MIFTSLGLLVLAGGLLIAGVARSSVTLLTLSLAVTGGAGLLLLVGYSAARRLAGVAPPVEPAVVTGAAPAPSAPSAATPSSPAAGNGHLAPPPPVAGAQPPIVGYDAMTAEQIVRLVASGALTAAQLAALHDYEASHARRKTVLRRIERVL